VALNATTIPPAECAVSRLFVTRRPVKYPTPDFAHVIPGDLKNSKVRNRHRRRDLPSTVPSRLVRRASCRAVPEAPADLPVRSLSGRGRTSHRSPRNRCAGLARAFDRTRRRCDASTSSRCGRSLLWLQRWSLRARAIAHVGHIDHLSRVIRHRDYPSLRIHERGGHRSPALS